MNTTTISRLAAATPDSRNRVVDFYRAIAISVVVLGHWLMAAVIVDGDGIHKSNTLDLVPSIHGLTWVLQVMPLFFLPRRGAPRGRRGAPGPRGSVPGCGGS